MPSGSSLFVHGAGSTAPCKPTAAQSPGLWSVGIRQEVEAPDTQLCTPRGAVKSFQTLGTLIMPCCWWLLIASLFIG